MKRSVRELRSTRALVWTALLLAAQVVLGLVASIPIGPSIRISFGYLAVATTAALFGPVPAMLQSGLCDVLVFLIKPTGPYFPGFTVSAVLGALIYGLCFYEREIRLRHVLIAKCLIDLFVNVLLNTLWLNMLYGKAFFALIPARFLKNLIQYPVDILLLAPIMLKIRKLAARLYG